MFERQGRLRDSERTRRPRSADVDDEGRAGIKRVHRCMVDIVLR